VDDRGVLETTGPYRAELSLFASCFCKPCSPLRFFCRTAATAGTAGTSLASLATIFFRNFQEINAGRAPFRCGRAAPIPGVEIERVAQTHP
jgi:hypothetical protein